MLSTANGIAAIALGAYLLVVVARGNGRYLWTQIQGELGFAKWGIAVAALWYLSTRPELGDLGAGMITIAALGLAIKVANDPTLLSGIASVWNALPNASVKTQ